MTDKKPYLIRGDDGVLHQRSVSWGCEAYADPGEAIKVWFAGELRPSCTERVHSGYSGGPCRNKPKHDPDHNGNPTKCGHHSAAAKQRKKDKADERDRKWREKWNRDSAIRALNVQRDEIIQKIAAGHNDPRGLCQDWLDAMAKLKGGDA